MKKSHKKSVQSLVMRLVINEGSQRNLAKRLGVSHMTVNLWMNGRINISLKHCKRLVELYGINIRELRPDLEYLWQE